MLAAIAGNFGVERNFPVINQGGAQERWGLVESGSEL